MEHLGTTFAFVLPIKHKHDCLQQEGRVAPTQGTSWEVVTWNQRIPAWFGSCHSIPPAIPSLVCSQVTQHLHTVTASSSFPAQPMPGIDIPESHLTPRSCTQTLHSSFPESRAHPSLQCVQLPSLWSGRSRAEQSNSLGCRSWQPPAPHPCAAARLSSSPLALCRAALGSAVCQRCLCVSGDCPCDHPSRQGQPSALPPNRDVQLHKNPLFFIYMDVRQY